MNSLTWTKYQTVADSANPGFEGHTLIKRGPNEYYSYGGHGGGLIFTRAFYRIDMDAPNQQIKFTDMTTEDMIGYHQVTTTVAYHQALYFAKQDVMVVFGGKLKSGDNAPMSNDLLLYYFKTKTWMLVDTVPQVPPLVFNQSMLNMGIRNMLHPHTHRKLDDSLVKFNQSYYIKTPTVRSHNLVKISESKFLSYGGTTNTRDMPADYVHGIYIFDLDDWTWEVNPALEHYCNDVTYLVGSDYSYQGDLFGIEDDEEELSIKEKHMIDPGLFDNVFVGRNYFSMNYDRKRETFYIFGGCICSKDGEVRGWDSNSLVTVKLKVLPNVKKMLPAIQSRVDSNIFSDVLVSLHE